MWARLLPQFQKSHPIVRISSKTSQVISGQKGEHHNLRTRNQSKLAALTSSSSSCLPDSPSEDLKFMFAGPRLKLFVYPPPPVTGGITVTNEDRFCLNKGEFLNDVIIDFYLNYISNSILSPSDRDRSHFFSCFFYERLMQKGKKNKDVSQAEWRHSLVKKWTRSVDLFSKEFIFIPINEASHWYLAVICFPSMADDPGVPNLRKIVTEGPPAVDSPLPRSMQYLEQYEDESDEERVTGSKGQKVKAASVQEVSGIERGVEGSEPQLTSAKNQENRGVDELEDHSSRGVPEVLKTSSPDDKKGPDEDPAGQSSETFITVFDHDIESEPMEGVETARDPGPTVGEKVIENSSESGDLDSAPSCGSGGDSSKRLEVKENAETMDEVAISEPMVGVESTEGEVGIDEQMGDSSTLGRGGLKDFELPCKGDHEGESSQGHDIKVGQSSNTVVTSSEIMKDEPMEWEEEDRTTSQTSANIPYCDSSCISSQATSSTPVSSETQISVINDLDNDKILNLTPKVECGSEENSTDQPSSDNSASKQELGNSGEAAPTPSSSPDGGDVSNSGKIEIAVSPGSPKFTLRKELQEKYFISPQKVVKVLLPRATVALNGIEGKPVTNNTVNNVASPTSNCNLSTSKETVTDSTCDVIDANVTKELTIVPGNTTVSHDVTDASCAAEQNATHSANFVDSVSATDPRGGQELNHSSLSSDDCRSPGSIIVLSSTDCSDPEEIPVSFRETLKRSRFSEVFKPESPSAQTGNISPNPVLSGLNNVSCSEDNNREDSEDSLHSNFETSTHELSTPDILTSDLVTHCDETEAESHDTRQDGDPVSIVISTNSASSLTSNQQTVGQGKNTVSVGSTVPTQSKLVNQSGGSTDGCKAGETPGNENKGNAPLDCDPTEQSTGKTNKAIQKAAEYCEDTTATNHSAASTTAIKHVCSSNAGETNSRSVYKQPCILIFDSLRGPTRSRTSTNLRE